MVHAISTHHPRRVGHPPTPGTASEQRNRGGIVPRVVTIGTVTSVAIGETWLTASNTKENRVGSEFKAIAPAPDGQAVIRDKADSEELKTHLSAFP